jgi:predicted flavoprotein YhiN
MHELSGLTISDVELTLSVDEVHPSFVDRRRGSFLFTHFGISGQRRPTGNGG